MCGAPAPACALRHPLIATSEHRTGERPARPARAARVKAITLLRMDYNRRTHEGQAVDGRWLVEGNLYDSPSGAAVGVARTKKGLPTNLDGWVYWYVKRPGSNEWVLIETLREQGRPSLEELGL
jgi:hypothetical protein